MPALGRQSGASTRVILLSAAATGRTRRPGRWGRFKLCDWSELADVNTMAGPVGINGPGLYAPRHQNWSF